jgi:hypothetical protein
MAYVNLIPIHSAWFQEMLPDLTAATQYFAFLTHFRGQSPVEQLSCVIWGRNFLCAPTSPFLNPWDFLDEYLKARVFRKKSAHNYGTDKCHRVRDWGIFFSRNNKVLNKFCTFSKLLTDPIKIVAINTVIKYVEQCMNCSWNSLQWERRHKNFRVPDNKENILDFFVPNFMINRETRFVK